MKAVLESEKVHNRKLRDRNEGLEKAKADNDAEMNTHRRMGAKEMHRLMRKESAKVLCSPCVPNNCYSQYSILLRLWVPRQIWVQAFFQHRRSEKLKLKHKTQAKNSRKKTQALGGISQKRK